MNIIKTVQLEKGDKTHFWDFLLNNQGYSIQRNGRTLSGRLSLYGGLQIYHDYVEQDKERGFMELDSREDEDQIQREMANI